MGYQDRRKDVAVVAPPKGDVDNTDAKGVYQELNNGGFDQGVNGRIYEPFGDVYERRPTPQVLSGGDPHYIVSEIFPVAASDDASISFGEIAQVPPPYHYIASPPFPYLFGDSLQLALAEPLRGSDISYFDEAAVSGEVLSGTIAQILVTYGDWPTLIDEEDLEVLGGQVLSGTITQVLRSYDDWPTLIDEESVEVGPGAVLSGFMTFPLLTYSNWPTNIDPESLEIPTAAVLSGVLA